MGTKYVYKTGMVHLAIARQRMIHTWVTGVILATAEESVLKDGSASTVTSNVYQETIQ